MLTYLEDTDAFEYWDGSAFTAFGGGGGAATNAIINGAFEINQRGFTSSTVNTAFGFDRWLAGLVDGTATYSAEAFSPGTGPAGYESANFARLVTSGQTAASAVGHISQTIEDVRNFAGQTATVSFFAKAASGTPQMAVELQQFFGAGGSPSSDVFTLAGKVTLSTSWQRFDLTVAVPSISGKTIGTTKNTSGLRLRLFGSAGSDFNARTDSLGIQSNTFDIWGVQVEAGSTASDFRRNANSLQGELAACQRYYYREVAIAAGSRFGVGYAVGASGASVLTSFPVQMRVAPTALETSGTAADYSVVTGVTITDCNSIPTFASTTTSSANTNFSVASGLTISQAIHARAASGNAFLGWSAEL
jgi:hypothetical protein